MTTRTINTKYIRSDQFWMLRSLFGDQLVDQLFDKKMIVDDVSIEELFEIGERVFFLYEKDNISYIAAGKTMLMDDLFGSEPRVVKGKELLSYPIASLEEAQEKTYARL